MQQQSIREWHVGAHSIRFEPPNLVKLTWKGEVLIEHVDGMYGHLDAIEASHYWMLSDISQSDVPRGPVRARLAQTQQSLRIGGIAVIVSSPYKRAVMDMLVRAVNLLTKTHVKTAFFDDENSARNWLAAEMKLAADSR
jgi:beta-phosphoglucomutase-like phosphatase (HAD superfamily)